jgi:hypothetical protein
MVIYNHERDQDFLNRDETETRSKYFSWDRERDEKFLNDLKGLKSKSKYARARERERRGEKERDWCADRQTNRQSFGNFCVLPSSDGQNVEWDFAESLF